MQVLIRVLFYEGSKSLEINELSKRKTHHTSFWFPIEKTISIDHTHGLNMFERCHSQSNQAQTTMVNKIQHKPCGNIKGQVDNCLLSLAVRIIFVVSTIKSLAWSTVQCAVHCWFSLNSGRIFARISAFFPQTLRRHDTCDKQRVQNMRAPPALKRCNRVKEDSCGWRRTRFASAAQRIHEIEIPPRSSNILKSTCACRMWPGPRLRLAKSLH